MPGGTDIWVLEFGTRAGGLEAWGPRNVTSRPGYDNQPHYATDGSLLYVAQEGVRSDLWRWNPATGTKDRLTLTVDASEYSPTPIPGGRGAISFVKVEPDSTQRLWRMERDGDETAVLFADIAPVGYHAWLDEEHVALYVLGEPATLQIAEVASGATRTVAEGIGRSPQAVPGRRAVSFTRQTPDGIVVEVYDADTDATATAATLPAGAEYHAWTPDGVLLTASDEGILAWLDDAWVTIADLEYLEQKFTRLAVSPVASQVAVVGEPAGG
jgi:Tol biopolymer transport system component